MKQAREAVLARVYEHVQRHTETKRDFCAGKEKCTQAHAREVHRQCLRERLGHEPQQLRQLLFLILLVLPQRDEMKLQDEQEAALRGFRWKHVQAATAAAVLTNIRDARHHRYSLDWRYKST